MSRREFFFASSSEESAEESENSFDDFSDLDTVALLDESFSSVDEECTGAAEPLLVSGFEHLSNPDSAPYGDLDLFMDLSRESEMFVPAGAEGEVFSECFPTDELGEILIPAPLLARFLTNDYSEEFGGDLDLEFEFAVDQYLREGDLPHLDLPPEDPDMDAVD
ncbi:uncharacterized protein LOC118648883 [Monomorium pharaonis]|uniref:uncharacterized protein LOC118648883 n=1 Tax=Monomorium pharaonis TaxID=307658 RepID=UPI001745C8E3|nr:uncharacterized protein LOC118648883 [Monomorium pharaonis]